MSTHDDELARQGSAPGVALLQKIERMIDGLWRLDAELAYRIEYGTMPPTDELLRYRSILAEALGRPHTTDLSREAVDAVRLKTCAEIGRILLSREHEDDAIEAALHEQAREIASGKVMER